MVTHAQTSGGPQHNHRGASSPQKSRPLLVNRSSGSGNNTTDNNKNITPSGGGNTTGGGGGDGGSRGDATTARATTGGASTITASGATASSSGGSGAHHAATCATFQRTSWYGAVSSHSPPPLPHHPREVKTQAAAGGDAGSGGGGGGGRAGAAPGSLGGSGVPNIVKKATGGASSSIDEGPKKPFVEPTASAGTAELKLPRQSSGDADDKSKTKDAAAGGKKPILTRLLRTPLSGGVLNSMKDADLPSVAVAARNLMELADYADLSTIMSDMNHRRSGYPFASTVDFTTDADGCVLFGFFVVFF